MKKNYYCVRTNFSGGRKTVETRIFGYTGEFVYNHNGSGFEIINVDFEKYVEQSIEYYKTFNEHNMWKWEVFLTDCPKDIYCDDWTCLNNKVKIL
jgi:hypothetical protein